MPGGEEKHEGVRDRLQGRRTRRKIVADRMSQDHRKQQHPFYSAQNEVLTIFYFSVVKEVIERKRF
jgi:hypothetical protein